MTTTDPTALARVVLALAHEDETVTVCTIPDNKAATLARAVLSLTAELDAYREENARLRTQVARVRAETFRLDEEGAHGVQDARDPHSTGWHDSQIIAARRIRTALNGDNA